MNQRTAASRLEWGLAALVALVHLLLTVLYILQIGGPNRLPPLLVETLPLVQLTLAAGWIAAGPGHIGPRLFVGLPLLWIIGSVWTQSWLPLSGDWPAQLGGRVTGLLLAIFIGLRLAGLQTLKIAPDKRDERHLQFSIAGLLIVTTVAALVLVVGQWVRSAVGSIETVPQSWRQFAMTVSFVIGAMATIWAILRPGNPILRWGIASAIVIAAGAMPGYLLKTNDVIVPFIFWLATYSAMLGLSLLPVRTFDYRLVWTRSPILAMFSTRKPSPFAAVQPSPGAML